MKNFKKIALIFTLIALLVAGCTKQPVKPAPAAEPIVEAPTEQVPDTSSTDPQGSAKIADKGTDTIGKLNGRIDGNSVEIEITPVDVLAFRVTDVLSQLEGIKDGEMVKFTYQANEDGQLNITKIEKAE